MLTEDKMYQSTRSNYTVSDTEAVLMGIAPDGGLFADPALIPGNGVPSFHAESCMGLPYTEMAGKIMSALLPGFSGFMAEITAVYPKKFSSDKITPLTKVGSNYALELYHGPTSAFKDVALSVLPLFITKAKEASGISETISILTATSGDTGKAALEGFHDVDGTDITVFFPDGGVSAMQKAQMVTQEGKNVRVCAVRGNFDDCQCGVKEAFAAAGKQGSENAKRLSSANSINIGRLVPQVVYYFSAYSQLIDCGEIRYGTPVDFAVPTGNFGDILAGYIALQLGLPIGRLICAANSNNVLADFISTGVYDRRRPFLKTVSPSMDILVSSNLERLLFYASEGDTELVSSLMAELNTKGIYTLTGKPLENIQKLFSTGSCSEEETAETIRDLWKNYGWLSDTHTAVAFNVLEKYKNSAAYTGNPCVVLSTASPFKFPAAVLSAIEGGADSASASLDDFALADKLSGQTGIPVPANLAGLKSKPVLHTDVIDPSELIRYVFS
ncbi:MAG: threonine synthase [Eubacteriales bacterium]|nr:threonine synthase [Eubacteriales bacterium]